MSRDHAAGIETKGYNRGLILGFTMAESLLLVVFCLLLVTAAIIAKERQRAEAALHTSEELRKELAHASERTEQLEAQLSSATKALASAAHSDIDKEWRELVIAQDTVDKIKVQLAEKESEKLLARIDSLLEDERSLAASRLVQSDLEKQLLEAKAQLLQAREALAKLQKSSKPSEWPPIISLSEANGNYFRSGSAELESTFTNKLNGSISNEIAANLRDYGADIVEIIGHTDEQPISRLSSNMDKNAVDVLSSKRDVGSLQPADNAGLGLARAMAVANVLRANPVLSNITVLPLSAAQLILPGDTLTQGQAGNVEKRRRIEIRIRRRDMPIQ
ncbi:hypothetical protein LAV84_20975 [Rhizobium sp. VS19-DR104.2]|uniref:hypothetical protein n=1 Tax=unclassified Rhizobium TaxID=2613769 RepID=UPI001CC5174B|nr:MULTISPECIES: hypothetical protein [unclassified Rhizobium]MBZ5762402.1 hypothetical protein [Rhizobium sp. VS19-DR96]MBZ5768447.1 hypothetical protein [Rhizobium sp. VS19-DR129.2]MBZ5776101.1 hypothetical protein [Rhizobium sp. VS19-DRK62.2]MBZ5786208.1 hypothetical protein [Rhizobium sp. VS19-DR121]MBZ5804480.1 hypothetical protein [Rhizobium sp. VS19-DR181]